MSKLLAISNALTGESQVSAFVPARRNRIINQTIYNLNRQPEKRLPEPINQDEKELNALPSAISASDVREVIQLLRRKPEGIKITKVLLETHKRIFEIKKIVAYEKLKIIKKEEQTVKLSPLGWKFTEQLRAETEIFRFLLLNTPNYLTALRWMDDSRRELVTADDVSLFWSDDDAKKIKRPEAVINYKEAAVTFFHLCQAADLGTMTLGKKGRVTRLLIDREEIEDLLAESGGVRNTESISRIKREKMPFSIEHAGHALSSVIKETDVLIIGAPEKKLARELETAFELSGISFQILNRQSPPRDSKFDAGIYRAVASSLTGCFVVGEKDLEKDSAGQNWRLKDPALCEIGAAKFGFRSLLILISTINFNLPEGLKDIALFQLNRNELTWETARKLVNKIKEMKTCGG
jgi:hypothetical protein